MSFRYRDTYQRNSAALVEARNNAKGTRARRVSGQREVAVCAPLGATIAPLGDGDVGIFTVRYVVCQMTW